MPSIYHHKVACSSPGYSLSAGKPHRSQGTRTMGAFIVICVFRGCPGSHNGQLLP